MTVKFYDGYYCDGNVVESDTYLNGCHQGTEEREPYKIEVLSCPEPEDINTELAGGCLYPLIVSKFVLIVVIMINV